MHTTCSPVRFPGDEIRTAGVAGAHGRLVQWTLDDHKTVLRTDADFERAMRDALAHGKDWLFSELCSVQDHMGQSCVAVQAHMNDRPLPSILVRFADGWELYVWSGDVVFD